MRQIEIVVKCGEDLSLQDSVNIRLIDLRKKFKIIEILNIDISFVSKEYNREFVEIATIHYEANIEEAREKLKSRLGKLYPKDL